MIHTLTEVDRLIELAIIQRAELKKLVDSLPELRTHLSIEIEKNVEQIEPHLRAELEVFLSARAKDENAKLGELLQSKIETLCDDLETTTAAKYSAITLYKEKVIDLEKIAEKKITEAGERIGVEVPAQVEKLVEEKFARFPRAGEIDQLRKEFAEPKGLNPRGKWESGVTYYKLDLVAYNGDSYVANEETTQKPSRTSTKWTLNAARGAAGSGNNVSLAELTGVPTNGQILIGSNGGYVNSDITAGDGIAISTAAGFIQISADGGTNYQGTWNAATNNPTLTSSIGTKGHYYVVNVDGSTNLNGITDWKVGDWAIYNGSVWQKVDNSESVTSVFGRIGSITAVAGDYSATQITNTAAGSITATNVQDAINELDGEKLSKASNLSDVASVTTSRTNLGLGSAAVQNTTFFLQAANSLSDVASVALARTNLGLGSAAVQSATYFLQVANNLSDVASVGASRSNLGLGTLATQNGTFSGNSSGTNTGDQTISITGDATASGSASVLTATVTKINGTSLAGLATGILKNTTTTGIPSIAVAADFPTLNQNTTGNAASASAVAVTGITGLGTGVSSFLQTPTSANLSSMVSDETGTGNLVFSNSPTLVTPSLGTPSALTLTNATGLPLTTGVSGTLPVANGGTGVTTSTGTGSNVLSASPTLTGTPIAPTAANGTNTTQIATTQYVQSNRGDKYLTTSTSTNTIDNGAGKTFNCDTGLSYIATQAVTIVYDINNHMHCTVVSYNSTTGVMVVDSDSHSGSGTFSAWTINLGGLTSAGGALLSANNLSDVASVSTSRTNLGVTATGQDTTYLYRANNLSDLSSVSSARTNLGLGTMATQNSSSVSISGGTLATVTLTTPTISSIINTGTLTLPNQTDTLVGRATTDTLTNKTLTSPILTTPTLGVASATSINKIAFTAPAIGSTLTIADGATLTASASATISGTHSGTSSGTNTGDQTISITGDVTAAGSTGVLTSTVTKINGTSLAGLATGILKNTTTTGVPSIAVAADFPTLNQNTTGSAATLTTPRAIYGNNFDGSAALTQAIAGTYGGTGVNNGANTITIAGNVTHAGAFTQSFTATANTALTLPTTGTLATLAGSEALSNKTITASAFNGTVGATTASTGAFTTLSANAGASFTSSTSAITYSEGLSGFGSFYAKGSGTNAAYLFLGNTVERGRISANNSDQVVVSVSSAATNIATFSSTGLAVTGALSATGAITGTGNSLLNYGGGNVYWQFESANNYVGRKSDGDVWLNVAAGYSVKLGYAGSAIATASSTGLAITGTLSTLATNGVNVFESAGVSSVGLQFKTNSTNRFKIETPSASNDLAFYAGGTTEVARLSSTGLAVTGALTATGNVGLSVGSLLTLNGNNTNAGYALQAATAASPYDFRFIGSSDSGTNRNFSFGYYASDDKNSTWNPKVTINSYTGAVRFNAYGAGALTTDASGNITAASDERIKSNIRPFSRGLAEILAINPILHGYTEESGLDQTRDDYAGFSAQQVQPLIPEAIGENANGMLSFSDRPVMAALVNAMKELNANLVAELQSLRQRVAALESN